MDDGHGYDAGRYGDEGTLGEGGSGGDSAALRPVEFSLEVEGAELPWRAVAFELSEAISEPWVATVDLVTEECDRDLSALAGRDATLRFSRARGDSEVGRVFRGVVTAVEVAVSDDLGATQRGPRARHRRVRVSLASDLWRLGEEVDSRIFQDRTVVEIAREVCGRAGISAERVESRLNTEPPRREYCVQYQESSLDFLQRTLAEEGIAFFIDASASGERVVLVDGSDDFPASATLASQPLAVVGSATGGLVDEAVLSLEWRRNRTRPAVYLRDYDFTRPMLPFSGPRDDAGGRATGPRRFEYPARVNFGGYDDASSVRRYTSDDLARRTAARSERDHHEAHVGAGRSNAVGLGAGHTVRVTDEDPGRPDYARSPFLVVSCVHRGSAPEALGTELAHQGEGPRYENQFTLALTNRVDGEQTVALPYRPAVRVRRAMPGVQSATVTGLGSGSSEEIVVDHHGRIRVRFHWDQQTHDRDGGRTSAWLRVMQPWAGMDWGHVFIPRVGMEVLVGFFDGDPDRPVVMGCLFNGAHRPPGHDPEHELPREKTRSIIRTKSTPGGCGYNELSFEDLAGREEVYLRAQRNLREKVLHDHIASVGSDETLSVGHDQRETVGHDRRQEIGRNHLEDIGQDHTQLVGRDRIARVERNDVVGVNGGQHVAVGQGAPGGEGEVAAGDQEIGVAHDRVVRVGNDERTEVGHLWQSRMTSGSAEVKMTERVIEAQAESRIKVRCNGASGESVVEMTNEHLVLRWGGGGGTSAIVLDRHGIEMRTSGKIKLANGGGATVLLQDHNVRLNA